MKFFPSSGIRTSAALSLIAAMALTACGAGGTQKADEASKPRVLTTFTVLEDIAQNVAGDHIEVDSLTKPGAEIHEYEPTPSDIRKAHDVALILDNGLNLESWFQKFVQDTKVKHVTVSEGVEVINIAEDAYAGKPNPHAWMSPSNVQVYADNIAKAFAELDPEHADDYRANADKYKQQLQGVRDDLVGSLEGLDQNKRTLVTCEGAFSYLAKDAGLQEEYLWAVNSENQATPSQVAGVIETVKERKVPAVFCESTVSADAMKQVVEATDAEFAGTLYVDSLSEEGGPVPTYLDLIKHDAETIKKGLTR